ncbi:hypothetical protein SNN70_004192 [Cronobacter malonaticus]|nr:hypothetical protein [Cronobacter malonaticus]
MVTWVILSHQKNRYYEIYYRKIKLTYDESEAIKSMEGKEILGEFERWVRKKANFDIVNNNNNNNKNKYSESIVIDFANDRNICRFTLWKDLICMLEIMDAETGRYKLNQ